MHILVVNDDGPPSNQSSPYVHSLISTLQDAGHLVSVVLPHVQRSWIGKAHIVGQTLTPTYFRPGTVLQDDGITSARPFHDGGEEWVLIDGTPASCAQIGLHHLFKDRGAIDLVISGPNYGRNTTAVFALSSGTIGGAMEAAMNGVKSIALSYAFDSREHDIDIISQASRLSTRLIEKLAKQWPDDVHLYSINVPLRNGVEKNKIVYTEMLQNRWHSGSSFTELPEDADDEDPNQEEQIIRETGEVNGNGAPSTRKAHRKFKWSPNFADVRKSVSDAGRGDGWEVLQGNITDDPSLDMIDDHEARTAVPIYALVDYPDAYVQPLILASIEQMRPTPVKLISSISDLPNPSDPVLQVTSYEALDFEHAMQHAQSSLVCAYVIRKALIRKHYLSNTVATWLVKHPESVLATHFKPSVHFELDYAEFLDDALVEAWDLKESMAENDQKESAEEKQWWILKPGMSDGGNGIRLFSSLAELQAVFDEWEEDDSGEDGQDSEDDDGTTIPLGKQDHSSDGNTMTSQLRHFIVQPYINPPVLLEQYDNRKFHIRTYVLAVGALKVYVCKEMLALFAAKAYQPPGSRTDADPIDLAQHLTNTCFQDEATKQSSVSRYWDLDSDGTRPGWKDDVFQQICVITGEVFEAAAREQMVHFQAIPNAFEIFGVDFLVDSDYNVWLLELNAYPDFKQTGEDFRDTVIGSLFQEVTKIAITPFFGKPAAESAGMQLVRSINLGRG
ncbi:putative tubulin--tyrosine ligase pby1 [Cladophialophora chaetospira]|uniref:Tubulin--tyrosine ligase pby1 n=1 Tax=Cladophialophora chaetospira TaxID=386627 RepID=A0AA39CK33_9EURO|nr:putative tubulin--tyrosine ligase pby1 [Cladophialophora chaetospira]